jgi:hypothetical protein
MRHRDPLRDMILATLAFIGLALIAGAIGRGNRR